MAGTVVADTLQAAATSTLLIQTGNGAPVTAVSIDTSQNVKFSGALRSNAVSTPPTIQDSAGTEIGTFCRAWVNFNGTGTVAIRASFNVTSITDVNSGRYVVNLTTALPDSNGAAVATAIPGTASDANSNRICYAAQISTTTIRLNITSVTSGTDWQDSEFIACSIFR